MPAMLRYLGDESFGLWVTAVAVVAVAAIGDLGIGSSLVTRLAQRFGSDNHEAMRVDIAAAYVTLAMVAASLGLVLAIAFTAVQFGRITIGGGPFSPDALAILGVVTGTFLLGMPASIILRVVQARQEALVASGFQVAIAATSIGACLAAIHLNGPVWLVIFAYSSPQVLLPAIFALWYFRRNRSLAPRFEDVTIASVRALLGVGSRFFILSIITTVALNLDSPIVAVAAGAEAVTNYAVPARLGTLAGLLVTSIYSPLWASNGEALARGDVQWVRKSSRRMCLIGGVAVGVCGLLLTVFTDALMEVWMSRSFPDQQLIVGLVVGTFWISAFVAPYNMILNSLGETHVQIVAWSAFLSFTVPTKLLLVDASSLWIIPLVSLCCYGLLVAPVILVGALRRLAAIEKRRSTGQLPWA